MQTNSKVQFFFDKTSKWQSEYLALRTILLKAGLTEDLKWGKPTYSTDGNNIVLIHGFKEYCALLLFKGVLIKDNVGALVQQTPDVQSARQLRFKSLEEVVDAKDLIKDYLEQAILIEQKGLKVEFKKVSELEYTEEFQKIIDETPGLIDAFRALSPGRQKGYLLFFKSAKLSKTRHERVIKYVKQIMEGRGIDD
jgi:uncharacterized protein YdeI (YjbR/CyaY-like superfamily)